MDRAPHLPDEPDLPELDDAAVEGLLAGDGAAASSHPELADLLADVRVAYCTAPPRVGDPLAARLGPSAPDPVARSADMSLSAPRRLARFALAVVVTAIASGGLALAGALPAPLSEDSDETTETTVETTVPDTTDDTTAPEPDAEEPEADEESEYRNHGEEVSDFARNTDLEGCEKGRAVSELASGKDLSHRPPCASDEDESDDPADADEADDTDADDTDETDEGVDGGESTLRSDRPGNSGEAPGHAKRD
jgi:hypothetical protein